MILSDKLYTELINLENDIHKIRLNKAINDLQMEAFLKNLEKRRYNILNEIRIYNKTVEYSTEKIKNISDEYKAEVKDNTLKIYMPGEKEFDQTDASRKAGGFYIGPHLFQKLKEISEYYGLSYDFNQWTKNV